MSAFEVALQHDPDYEEAKLGLCEAHIKNGQHSEALRKLEPLLSDGGADAWCLTAQAAAGLGAADDAKLFAHTTLQALNQKPFLAPHRKRMQPLMQKLMVA